MKRSGRRPGVTTGLGGRAYLKAMTEEDAKARVLEVLREHAGCVSHAARALRFCCRAHFWYWLSDRGLLDELQRIRVEVASTFALPGMPPRRRAWAVGFHAMKSRGQNYKPGTF